MMQTQVCKTLCLSLSLSLTAYRRRNNRLCWSSYKARSQSATLYKLSMPSTVTDRWRRSCCCCCSGGDDDDSMASLVISNHHRACCYRRIISDKYDRKAVAFINARRIGGAYFAVTG